MKIRNPFKNLTVFEWCLWAFSLTAIVSSFLISHFIAGYDDYANLAVSLIGVTSLIFAARGDVFGMMLMIAFSLIYAFVSFMTKYYGETIIYTCMQLPCAITSLVSWFRHPSDKGTAEVKVGKFSKKHIFIMVPLVAGVTCAFYFILRAFGTANLIPGTISVATSLTALYLMILRVPAYALAFILNDIVLIVLWSLACVNSLSYLSLAVCFSIFLINDTYTFICWTKRKRLQTGEPESAAQPDVNQN